VLKESEELKTEKILKYFFEVQAGLWQEWGNNLV